MIQPDEHIAGVGFIESFVQRYPESILETLLQDRATGKHIIWADNEYEALGAGYMGDDEITIEKITGLASGVIKPRIAKAAEKRSQRTKSRAEVFTPSWLCNQMNNDIDEVWFGRRDVFNTEVTGEDGEKTWVATTTPIEFSKEKSSTWRDYVSAARLEITCGEAPFICSRYDTVTGKPLAVGNRIGFLDRKLRVVSENTKTRKTWMKWALTALQATYGYEYQGDNLLIARINVFETLIEHARERWGSEPEEEELAQIAFTVSWNLWQMDGLNDAVPTNKMGAVAESPLGEQSKLFETEEPVAEQLTMFDLADIGIEAEETPKVTTPLCVLRDWETGEAYEFAALKRKGTKMGKVFYAVIGNPPYQEQTDSESTRMPPIYNYFMDESNKVGERVELITPARFLFNAGFTSKEWNKKMLNDPHFKVLDYKQKSGDVFPNTDIRGGVAITYRNPRENFGAISIFTTFPELNSIVQKTLAKSSDFLSDIVYPALSYKATDLMTEEHQELLPRMKSNANPNPKKLRLRTNAFDNLPEIFYEQKPDEQGKSYIKLIGLANGRRTYRWIESRYVNSPNNLKFYKVILPKSNGSGALGEVLSTPLIGQPLIGHTQTFISIGCFENEENAKKCLKYIKTKYARVTLGVLKITQDNPPEKWAYVPMQDFTSMSDIDWSQSISDIDQQLYKKYGLDDTEIEFIETHVQEMS